MLWFCLKPIFLCLFSSQFSHPLLGGIGAIFFKEEAASTLTEELAALEAMKTDTEKYILLLETAPVRRTKQLEDWLKNVDLLTKEVHEFMKSFVKQQAAGRRPIWDDYHAGRHASTLMKQVHALKDQKAGFDILVKKEVDDDDDDDDDASSSSEVVPTSISIVGAEETLFTIRQLILSNDRVKIIGIYGMGGVGKTTLLTKIYGEMKNHFDNVIWVTVSREVNIFKIQESIGAHLSERLPAEEGQRARFLSSILCCKNVLLLLDDMWEKLDLVKIGIPLPHGENNKCKVAITTRSEEVCIAMQAQEKVKVMPLPERESWELFCRMIGGGVDLDNPSIEPLAKEVVAKCGGLPLTIVTVGRAMENATTVMEWNKAIKNLKESPHEIQGMHNVLSLLKFSFDRLRNDSLRWCLLYCISCPEDYEMSIPFLKEYWVGEGIFSGHSRHDALEQAYKVVEELKVAGLLEDCGDQLVKMHDGIRDMALWLSSGDNDNNDNVIFSFAGLGLTECPMVERWGEAKLISLMENNIETLPEDTPDCSNLTSLIITENPSLKKPISELFFSSMPMLRVLDLSHTGIEELPKSIGLLVELQYLNLSFTNIHSLPEQIGHLQKLRQLTLWKTDKLLAVPRREILKLSTLQCLDISYSNYIWDANDADGSDKISVETADLEVFNQLEDLGLTISTSSFLRVLLSSHSWSKAMKYLSLQVRDLAITDMSTAIDSLNRMSDLQICNALELEELLINSRQFLQLDRLRLLELPMLTRIIVHKEDGQKHKQVLPSLSTLEIGSCNLLRDFNWINELSTLTNIDLHNCKGMEELLLETGDEENELNCSLRNLKTLSLGWMPKLRCISRRPLLLPSLQFISVYGCPKLKSLPFTFGSAKKIKTIEGSQRWWDRLAWNADAIKANFLPHFTVDKWAEEEEENLIPLEDWEEAV